MRAVEFLLDFIEYQGIIYVKCHLFLIPQEDVSLKQFLCVCFYDQLKLKPLFLNKQADCKFRCFLYHFDLNFGVLVVKAANSNKLVQCFTWFLVSE